MIENCREIAVDTFLRVVRVWGPPILLSLFVVSLFVATQLVNFSGKLPRFKTVQVSDQPAEREEYLDQMGELEELMPKNEKQIWKGEFNCVSQGKKRDN